MNELEKCPHCGESLVMLVFYHYTGDPDDFWSVAIVNAEIGWDDIVPPIFRFRDSIMECADCGGQIL